VPETVEDRGRERDHHHDHYDAVVIGAGQGGGPFASALGAAGRRTALVERADVGGTCVNTGCTPTKTMAASARVAHLARRAGDYGVRLGDVAVDMTSVRQRKRAIVERFRAGSERSVIESDGVELVRGEARFVGPKRLAVRLAGGGGRTLSADLVVIDVGGRPAMPPVDGIERVAVLDSTTVMELGAVPRRLLILGGGYVAVEFAQMFRRFGSEVAVVQRGPRLLGREDADVAEAVAAILGEEGVELLLGAEATGVEPDGDGVRVAVRTADGARTLAGSHLLAATGRVPNTDALDPAAGGVATDERGYVRVDERLRTTAPGVYAIGDAVGGPAFTHVSYDDFRILRANLLDGEDRTTTDRLVPYVVYTDPQLGRVGLGEEEARRAGRAIRVAKLPMSSVARALETGEPRGFMKAVVDAGSDRILGCAVLGVEGGELMSLIQVAMLGGLPYTALRDGVFAHPALAESVNNLFATLA
jgi:pyruvate/2-oxoglutarate dehydrogenase complex dihydrolipoamide dehydrogenase (E3) component